MRSSSDDSMELTLVDLVSGLILILLCSKMLQESRQLLG
jgi:hypothetical protein